MLGLRGQILGYGTSAMEIWPLDSTQGLESIT
jgi:hypothetical protein